MRGSIQEKLLSVTGMVIALVMMTGVLQADAWWDAKWQYRKKVAFDTTDKGAGVKDNLTEVPVLLRLHAGNFTFANAKDDGSDIRFVGGDDKTPLKAQLEKYDPKLAIGLFWVKVPQIAGGSAQDSIWIYYGNNSVSAVPDDGGTYDATMAAAFHFDEKDGKPHDATAYANHAAEFSGKLGIPAAIGNGAAFNGSSDKLVIKRSPSLNFSKGFTFSTWLKPAGTSADARLFSWDDGSQSIVVGLDPAGAYCRITGGGKQAVTGKTPAITSQGWHHLAVSAEPGKRVVVYLDGREAAAAPLAGALPSPAAELAVGATLNGGGFYAGEMDEVEISSVARSAGWIGAAFGSQGQEGKLSAYQQEEAGGKGGGDNMTIHLMRIISRSISLDGWLVIGLCTGMLLLATYVFVRKFIALQRITKGNHAFLAVFAELDDPLALNEEEEAFQHSSLWRIYCAAYDEVQRCLERTNSSKKNTLSRAALNYVEAALDRANTNETKKLNAWMMVLTLGISGGPFWGLLGTVWGVMNTFASLAESGEASLAAIAPGVASALACTLFGLLVAIPALFAYTYLAAQMKNVNIDTRLFIEELNLKIEGNYGESA